MSMERLPSELLVEVASFTSGKDVIALRQVDSRWKSLMQRNQAVLPKPQIDLTISAPYRRDRLDVEMKLPGEIWTWTASLRKMEEENEGMSDDDKKGKVNGYYRAREGCTKSTRGSYSWGVSEGLKHHLEWIVKHAEVRQLTLEGIKPEDVDVIRNVMTTFKAKAEELCIHKLGTPEDNLIKEINPAGLFLREETRDEVFERLHFRRLKKLHVSRGNDDTPTPFDSILLGLCASDLSLGSCVRLTLPGMRAFILEWATGKREIVNIVFDIIRIRHQPPTRAEWEEEILGEETISRHILVEKVTDNYAIVRRLSDHSLIQVHIHYCYLILETIFSC